MLCCRSALPQLVITVDATYLVVTKQSMRDDIDGIGIFQSWCNAFHALSYNGIPADVLTVSTNPIV